jgi:hypothetical protein
MPAMENLGPPIKESGADSSFDLSSAKGGPWAKPELPVFLFLCLVSFLLLLRHSFVLKDLDIGWLLRYGEMIWQTRHLPEADVFSFTQTGKHWFLYQWGFEAYLGGLYKVAGLGGVVWGTAVPIALTYSLLLYFLLTLGLNRIMSIGLCILAAATASHYWFARPGTMNFLFFLIVLILLEKYRQSPHRQLWGLPPIFLFWGNLHIGFVMGLGTLFLYGLWASLWPQDFRGVGHQRDFRILKILFLCLGVLCLNPHGVYLFTYVKQATSSQYLNDNILELLSPNFHYPICALFFLQIILIYWLSVIRYQGRSLFFTLLSITLAMSLYSARHITFFSMTATLVLAQLLIFGWGWKATGRFSRMSQGWGWAAVGIVASLLLVVGINCWWPNFYDFEDRAVPKGVAAFLATYASETSPIRVCCDDDQWSSYLIYRLYPGIRVFMDSRYEFYGEEFIKTATRVQRRALYDLRVLNAWGVNFWVLKKNDLPARPEATPDWALFYEDDQACIYGHLPSQTAAATGKKE